MSIQTNTLINRIKDLLRPIKIFLLRVLVILKRNYLFLSFRLSRMSKVAPVLLGHGVPPRIWKSLGNRIRFQNGMISGLGSLSLIFFSLFRSQQIQLLILGRDEDIDQEWLQTIRKQLHAGIYFSEKSNTEGLGYRFWQDFRRNILQHSFQSDVLIIDPHAELPSTIQVLELMHGLRSLHLLGRKGAIHPSYSGVIGSGQNAPGIVFNSAAISWEFASTSPKYRDGIYPRHVLNALPHCLLMSNEFVRAVLPPVEDETSTWQSVVTSLIQSGWMSDFATVCYPQVCIRPTNSLQGTLSPEARDWLTNRADQDPKRPSKVIFVLPAMTLSGGIRVVFEKAQGLIDRGIEAEIWSLRSNIAWDTGSIPIRQFRTYLSLCEALKQETAIKVATWWETAEVVFLASIHRGTPVQYVQEFETWFYPDSPTARAAVVASYRPEFSYVTTANFQQDELREIGIDATLIPVGYDETIFKILDTSTTRKGMIAVGRSFFQKNFSFTAKAWSSLGKSRPDLTLFGHEPGILKDSKVTYFDFPSSEKVNELYNNASFFVQTSLHEGFSLPIIEAMAAGCPVITTDSHGNRGFCFPEENCLLVEQNDVPALAAAINRLNNDPILRARLSEAGLRTAREYRWESLLDKYADYYRNFSR